MNYQQSHEKQQSKPSKPLFVNIYHRLCNVRPSCFALHSSTGWKTHFACISLGWTRLCIGDSCFLHQQWLNDHFWHCWLVILTLGSSLHVDARHLTLSLCCRGVSCLPKLSQKIKLRTNKPKNIRLQHFKYMQPTDLSNKKAWMLL